LREVVAARGRLGALPHRRPLDATPDTVAFEPDAEDDFTKAGELVVKWKRVEAMCSCSEQRVSRKRAWRARVGLVRMCCLEAHANKPATASAPLERRPLYLLNTQQH
jgi:hypothetical protein